MILPPCAAEAVAALPDQATSRGPRRVSRPVVVVVVVVVVFVVVVVVVVVFACLCCVHLAKQLVLSSLSSSYPSVGPRSFLACVAKAPPACLRRCCCCFVVAVVVVVVLLLLLVCVCVFVCMCFSLSLSLSVLLPRRRCSSLGGSATCDPWRAGSPRLECL